MDTYFACSIDVSLTYVVDDVDLVVGLVDQFANDFGENMALSAINVSQKFLVVQLVRLKERFARFQFHVRQEFTWLVTLCANDRNRFDLVALPLRNDKSQIHEVAIPVKVFPELDSRVKVSQRSIVSHQCVAIRFDLVVRRLVAKPSCQSAASVATGDFGFQNFSSKRLVANELNFVESLDRPLVDNELNIPLSRLESLFNLNVNLIHTLVLVQFDQSRLGRVQRDRV